MADRWNARAAWDLAKQYESANDDVGNSSDDSKRSSSQVSLDRLSVLSRMLPDTDECKRFLPRLAGVFQRLRNNVMCMH
jgi:hypothetical protein